MKKGKDFEEITKKDLIMSTVETTEKYWDCECEKNFIHPKTQTICNMCGAIAEEQPDSRKNEVLAQGFLL